MTRGQLMAAGLLQVGAAAAAGAVAAAGLAIAASPLMPIGTARLAEPDPGVSADAAVLTAGAVVMVVLAWPGWRGRPGAWRRAVTAARRRQRRLAGRRSPGGLRVPVRR